MKKMFFLTKKLASNRVGSSYWFLYAMIFAFILTMLFIIFNQTLKVYIYPTTEMLGNDTGIPNTTSADKWLSFWDLMPFIIVLIIVLFIFFRTTQSDAVGG